MVIIGRPINGVFLNGNEYVLDASGKPMRFESEKEAKMFLCANGYRKKSLEKLIENHSIILEEEGLK